MIARTRIGLENEAAAEKDSERRTQEGRLCRHANETNATK
eukprot:CAMPEP_0204000200 /NCGR_PEP_ID=MMETSP0360-20130528/15168_1 /ASSEMBLY_ACC=CAM_ASM_000342 /TAXON_ID=268821 /ORGANISM="Scrippsiella Hangoei, Strain SHTV-5" /LENGTH=39 /DNA_ID= /DNA_START= /DNA_END= /DNA_ORIENTATION=